MNTAHAAHRCGIAVSTYAYGMNRWRFEVTNVLAEYSRIKKQRKEEREAENRRVFAQCMWRRSDGFSIVEDVDGKFLRITDKNSDVIPHVMFFLASNRWKFEDLDYYGTFYDFMKWYNKRSVRFVIGVKEA